MNRQGRKIEGFTLKIPWSITLPVFGGQPYYFNWALIRAKRETNMESDLNAFITMSTTPTTNAEIANNREA